MRIGKTRVFLSLKYILPALALLLLGALAIIKNSSAATCSGYYICYAATQGGQVVDRYNHDNPIAGDQGGDYYAGNGAFAKPNEGYVFVEWQNEEGEQITTDQLFIPCGPMQGCTPVVVSGKTYTAVFAPEGGSQDPTAATETFTLGARVDEGVLNDQTVDLTLSAVEDDAPMPGNTRGTIAAGFTSISFDEITFPEEGTWRYKIIPQAPSGVLLDTNMLEIRVVATLDQANNKIVTEKTLYKNNNELTTIDDFYIHVSAEPVEDPTPATESFTLPVSVENGALEGNETIAATISGAPAPATTEQSIKKETSSVSFGEVTISEPGSYRYLISVNNEYSTALPDALNLEVKIDASLDEQNNAIVTEKTYYKNNSEISESEFKLNILLVAPTPVTDSVSLDDLIESDADLSDFSASMTAIGDSPAPAKSQGEIIDDASVIFGDITFTEPGSYEYNLEFKNGDKTLTIRFVTDATVNRNDNTIQLSGRAYDEDGNQINYDQLRELVAELLAKEQPDDHGDDSDDDSGDDSGDDSSDDSDDSSDTPSSDTPDTPNTSDAILRVAPLAILSFAGVAVGIVVARKISR